MFRFYSIFVFLVIVSVLISCKSTRLLTIDLTVPPDEGLPPEIQSLTLVNRAVDKRFTDEPADSIQLRFYRSQFNLDTVIYDTKAADTLVQALGNVLFESGRFDVVIPENRFLKKDTLNQFSDQLSREEAEELTRRFDTDAVLSLDYYKTGIFAAFGSTKNVNWDVFSEEKVFSAGMRIDYTANFRLYYPGSREEPVSYFLTDTLLWRADHIEINLLFKSFTKVKAALIETSLAGALNLSRRIAPTWKSFTRAYFSSGSRDLRETAGLVRINDWEAALQKWKESAQKVTSKSLLSKLEFNIALAYEMQGDLDEAIRWGLKSFSTFFRPVTYNYLNILKERKRLFEKNDEKAP